MRHWVRTGKDRWIEQQRADGWRIVAVELADGAIALHGGAATSRTVILLGHEWHGIPDQRRSRRRMRRDPDGRTGRKSQRGGRRQTSSSIGSPVCRDHRWPSARHDTQDAVAEPRHVGSGLCPRKCPELRNCGLTELQGAALNRPEIWAIALLVGIFSVERPGSSPGAGAGKADGPRSMHVAVNRDQRVEGTYDRQPGGRARRVARTIGEADRGLRLTSLMRIR